MVSAHVRGDHERDHTRDVCGGHGCPLHPHDSEVAIVATIGGLGVEAVLTDLIARRLRLTVEIAGRLGALVLASAGGDQVEAGAVIGVVGGASAVGRRPDSDDLLGSRRVQHPRGVFVAGRGDNGHALVNRVLDRAADGDDLLAVLNVGREVEAQVDDVRAVSRREPDTPRDLAPFALLVAIEDPDRHHLGAVGDPGQAEAIVCGLRDGARDVSAVTLGIERDVAAVDEILWMDEPLRDRKIGIVPVAVTLVAVGHSGVEHGDRDAPGAGMPDGDQPLPARRDADADR